MSDRPIAQLEWTFDLKTVGTRPPALYLNNSQILATLRLSAFVYIRPIPLARALLANFTNSERRAKTGPITRDCKGALALASKLLLAIHTLSLLMYAVNDCESSTLGLGGGRLRKAANESVADTHQSRARAHVESRKLTISKLQKHQSVLWKCVLWKSKPLPEKAAPQFCGAFPQNV